MGGGDTHSVCMIRIYACNYRPAQDGAYFQGPGMSPRGAAVPTSFRIGQSVWFGPSREWTRHGCPFVPASLSRFMPGVACLLGRFDCRVVSVVFVLKSLSPRPCRTLSQAPNLPAPAGPPDPPGKPSEMPPDKLADSANAHTWPSP